MANVVKILRSTTAGNVPSSLVSGQIAINEKDGKLFWRDETSGQVYSVTINGLDAAVASKVSQTGATGAANLPNGTTAQRPSGTAGQLRYNSTTGKFEGYGSAWGNIGGGAAIGDSAPSNPGAGDLWWNSADGILYVYYNDGSSSQWVATDAGGEGQYLPLTGGAMSGPITLAKWTTAGRPSSPSQGQTGYNTTLNAIETYNGSAWVVSGANKQITQTIYTSGSGTYTVPAGVTWLRVRMVGGGSSGGTQTADPASGGTTTFGSSYLTCNGGGTSSAGVSCPGGGASGGDINIAGEGGQGGSNSSIGISGNGGVSPFGGAGSGGNAGSSAGTNAAANSGSGGGGGYTNSSSRSGGGAGGYLEKIITSPASSYTYAVGAGGSGVTNAGNGGSGVIIIEEHYNW